MNLEANKHFDDEVVRVSCVRHSYEDGTDVHLCGLDFIARRGQRVAVLGPNGAGKTTMLYHILGLLRSREGLVRVFDIDPGKNWSDIRRRIGVILQNVEEQLLAPTVADDVAFSPRQYGLSEEDVAARVDRALTRLDIVHLRDRVPHNLSGGEKRKVAFAGALVMDPELLVLDEPFEGLDPRSREAMVALLHELADAGTTIVMSTHDIDAVPELADYAYVLAPGGRIALSGTPDEVFGNPDALAASNIKPPVLAELFALLHAGADDAPGAALSVEAAAESLLAWRTK
ncbi:MAG: ABC transporter [Actinobacteria bacterium HGW-Actinobacteria-10]|jgi:cobalt/nickel transport system ATP-binding protein|nr:MAG: ABC transporter [Actinobacteria bacterium HGW-Actinobacteria-10]